MWRDSGYEMYDYSNYPYMIWSWVISGKLDCVKMCLYVLGSTF